MNSRAENVSIVGWSSAVPAGSDAAMPPEALEAQQFSRQLLVAIGTAKDEAELLEAVGLVLGQAAEAQFVVHLRQAAESRAWKGQSLFLADGVPARCPDPTLATTAQAACAEGRLVVRQETSSGRHVVAAVPVPDGDGELSVLLAQWSSARAVLPAALAMLHAAAAAAACWRWRQRETDAQREAQWLAGLVELLQAIHTADDVQEAARALAAGLVQILEGHRCVIGLRGRNGMCRALAVSGSTDFDAQSEWLDPVEAALDEITLREGPTVWPPPRDEPRHGMRVQEQLAGVVEAQAVLGVPLRDAAGQIIGACLCWGSAALAQRDEPIRFLEAASQPIGAALDLARRAEPGMLRRQMRRAAPYRRWLALGAVLLAAGMAWPIPYRVAARCEVQPVVRRYVAAPFDGILQETFVQPGDVVSRGQRLARMDDREIRWELAGLEAERARAEKQRDAAMAQHQTAAAQQAQLEMAQLDLRIQLLRNRADNLEIKSPIDGIVVSGDLRKAQGAPLTVGQSLFEIAPLSEMTVEVLIPQRELSHVQPGQEVRLEIDALPGTQFTGTLNRLAPRAEIRDEEVVFIGELALANDHGGLWPGMRGRAKITTAPHSVAWNYLHRPWQWLRETLLW